MQVRHRVTTTLIMVLATIVGLVVAAAPAQAQTTVAEPLPAGCAGGSDALLDVAFINERGDVRSDLRRLDVGHGEVVTMRWSAWADGCINAAGEPHPVSMASYPMTGSRFDISANELLLPGWVTCVDLGSCAAPDGGYQIEVTTPSPEAACFFQLDAVLGEPLEVVGPDGSFYSEVLRRDGGANLLIGAKNTGSDCDETPATTIPAPTTTVAAPTTTAPTTTAPAPTTTAPTTTAPAPTTTATPPTSEAPDALVVAQVEEPAQVKGIVLSLDDEVKVKSASLSAPVTLPRTGAGTATNLVMVALGLLGAGITVLTAGRRIANRA